MTYRSLSFVGNREIMEKNMSLCFQLLLMTTVMVMVVERNEVSGYTILVTGAPYYSHIFSMGALCKSLASRGHQVHFVVAANFYVPIDPNTTNIQIERYGSPAYSSMDYVQVFNELTQNILAGTASAKEIEALAENIYQDDYTQMLVHSEPLFQKLSEIKFDIAVIDGMFTYSYPYLIPLRLGIPWVSRVFLLSPWQMSSPILPSFVPSNVSPYSDRMTFKERILNTLYTLIPLTDNKDPPEEIIEKYRKYGTFEKTQDLVAQSLIFFTAFDIALDYPIPTMPNMIHAGGFTVQPASGRPLPHQIHEFLTVPNEGVILIAFGTLSKSLPKHAAETLIQAFRQLPNYRVIWRLVNKDQLSIPDNVLISDWLPQNDLLADHRVKLFITHCGNNGQFEAMYHAVPMIGFPLYVDQGYNAKRIETKGFGVAMNIQKFTADELVENIKRIINDKSFKSRITRASEVYRSAKETPVERVAYWVEHVIKFGGDHLKSAGRDLNVFQYLMLDILALLLLAITTSAVVVGCIVKMLIRCCCKMSDNRIINASENKKSK